MHPRLREGIMTNIDRLAFSKYSEYEAKNEFEVKALPSEDEFVEECFANGNILLTASKDEKIKPEYRSDLALFADGKFYVSNRLRVDGERDDAHRVYVFRWLECKTRVTPKPIYVPQSYIDKLYIKAQEFEWFEPMEM